MTSSWRPRRAGTSSTPDTFTVHPAPRVLAPRQALWGPSASVAGPSTASDSVRD
jgi:hypothetical protein